MQLYVKSYYLSLGCNKDDDKKGSGGTFYKLCFVRMFKLILYKKSEFHKFSKNEVEKTTATEKIGCFSFR